MDCLPNMERQWGLAHKKTVSEIGMPVCYMCDREATTAEHAPPRCIFPEVKDTPSGFDYRKNLITVPSCDEHNTARSKDDEYLLHVLAASVTSSDIGLTQFLTKVSRSLERNPRLIAALPVSDVPTLLYVPHRATLEEAYEVPASGTRIDSVISSCARALYYHETERKFSGRVKVVAPFMSYRNVSLDNVVSVMALAKTHFFSAPSKGENPDVFYYKFEEGPSTGIMLLCFYGGTEFLVQFDSR